MSVRLSVIENGLNLMGITVS